MTKNKKHLCCYKLQKMIVHRLNRTQLFILCILALIVVAIIGIYAPAALIGLL